MHSKEGMRGKFSIFDSFILGNVTFYRGGFGAKYGDALSGIVDIRTRDGNFTRFTGSSLVSFSQFHFTLEGPLIKNKASVLLALNWTFSELVIKQQRENLKFDIFPYSWGINFKYSFNINTNQKLEFFTFSNGDNVGLNIERHPYAGHLAWKNKQGFFSLRHIYFFKDKGVSEFSFSYNPVSNNLKFSDSLWEHGDFNQLAFRWDVMLNLKKNYILKTGFEIRRNYYEKEGFYPSNHSEPSLIPDPSWKIYKHDVIGTKYGGYLQNQINLFRGFVLKFGVRGDYFDVIKKGSIDMRLSLACKTSKSFSFHFATGTYHQFPGFDYLIFSKNAFNLRPMNAMHYIFGVEKNLHLIIPSI